MPHNYGYVTLIYPIVLLNVTNRLKDVAERLKADGCHGTNFVVTDDLERKLSL